MALLGFRRIKSSGGGGGGGGRRRSGGGGGGGGGAPNFTDAQVVSLISARLGSNPTQAEMAKAYQDLSMITGKAQPEAQIEMVKLETKSRELAEEQGDINSTVDQFDTELGTTLNQQASLSYGDPYALSGAYASEYSLAEEKIYAKIDDLMASGRGTESSIKALREKAKEYNGKAMHYGNLREAYYSLNADGKIGPATDTQYAYVPKINPATGKMSGVEILNIADLDTKKYMATDTSIKTFGGDGVPIKMYLPVTEIGRTEDDKPIMGATIGGITYKQQDINEGKKKNALGMTISQMSDTLVAQKKDEGLNVLGFGISDDVKNFNSGIDDIRTNGFDVGAAIGFDSKDPGNDKLIRSGSRWLYKNDAGQLMEIEGSDENTQGIIGPQRQTKQQVLANYLRSIGKDDASIGRILEEKYQLGVKDIPEISPDNFINENYFNKGLPTPGVPQALPMRPTTPVGVAGQAAGQAIGAVASKFFAGRQQTAPAAPSNPSTPNKPDVAPESSGGIKSAGDIIAKGAKFFGGLLTSPGEGSPFK